MGPNLKSAPNKYSLAIIGVLNCLGIKANTDTVLNLSVLYTLVLKWFDFTFCYIAVITCKKIPGPLVV